MSSYKSRALALQSEVDRLKARARAKAKLQATIRELRARVRELQTAAPVRRATAPRTAAKARAGGEHWSDHLVAAWQACKAKHGPTPWFVAGACPWVELAPKSRSWTSARGVKVKWNPVCRLPAERYWPKGTFPAVSHIAAEKPRKQLTKAALAAELARARKLLPKANWNYCGGHHTGEDGWPRRPFDAKLAA